MNGSICITTKLPASEKVNMSRPPQVLTCEDGVSSPLLAFDCIVGGEGGAGGGAIRLRAEMTVKISGGVYVNGADGQGDPGNSLR